MATRVRRYDLAAAFFLLAKNVREAVGVLAHERGDPQLALMVARIAEGGAGGPAGSLVIHNVSDITNTHTHTHTNTHTHTHLHTHTQQWHWQ